MPKPTTPGGSASFPYSARPYYCECQSWQCQEEIKITDQEFAAIRAANPKHHIVSYHCETSQYSWQEVERRYNYRIIVEASHA